MDLEVSRILHAGYEFKYGEFRILFDPIFESPFSQNCHSFPAVKFDLAKLTPLRIDSIFISHFHEDHFSLESLNHLNRNIPIYIFSTFDEFPNMLEDLGFAHVQVLKVNDMVKVGPFNVNILEALDVETDSIFHIQIAGLNILNVVDSWIGPITFDKLQKIKRWDLILWPFQSMREIEVLAPYCQEPNFPNLPQIPTEHLEQIRELAPKFLVPSSCQFLFEDWSWYNQAFFPISYKEFSVQVGRVSPTTLVQKMNPGEKFILDKNQFKKIEPLNWIITEGDQDLDYTFDSQCPPPPFEHFAQKFPRLHVEELNQLNEFLNSGLAKAYNQLQFDAFDDPHFKADSIWQLRIYNYLGQKRIFNFTFLNEKLVHTESDASPTWVTEVTEFKLFSALFEGESLTSVYIRVTNPKNTDPLQDPLIRALYEGKIGSYQLAQLRRLQNANSETSNS